MMLLRMGASVPIPKFAHSLRVDRGPARDAIWFSKTLIMSYVDRKMLEDLEAELTLQRRVPPKSAGP